MSSPVEALVLYAVAFTQSPKGAKHALLTVHVLVKAHVRKVVTQQQMRAKNSDWLS